MIDDTASAQPLNMGQTELGQGVMFSISGPLTFSNCAELEASVEEVSGRYAPLVVVDCRAVSLMDSAALEMLVKLHHTLRQRKGHLVLIQLNDVCRDIFVVTRLINMLSVYDDIASAMKSIKKS